MVRNAILAFFLVPTLLMAAASSSRPNIVMILADDMGWADLGHDGSKIDTPNLDRLAREGVKLTSFRASAPMCSPTRAALLTGRYPHSVGMPALASPTVRGDVPVLGLAHEAVTIPEALKPAGYRSILVGKWHLGFEKQHWPRTHGFDEFWGSLIGTPQFWQVKETYHNETPITVSGYYTDALTDKAIAYLRESAARRQPAFLYLAYNAPHYPLEAPADLVDKYRRRFPDRGFFASFAAMVERLDAGIGRVLAALKELKVEDDTLVVFTSDNGPSAELNSYGPAGAEFSNGPLREYKFSVHDGGLRVPFIARWPGRIPAGEVRRDPAVMMDLLPTFLEAAGVRAAAGHEIHGVSLLPLLTGGRLNRPGAVHWETQDNAAVLLGEWKLVYQFWNERPFLYRIEQDIEEMVDRSGDLPEKAAELAKMHESWKARHYPNPLPRRTKRNPSAFPAPRTAQ